MTSIGDARDVIAQLPPGQVKESWKLKLEQLKAVSVQNETSKEELEAGMQFVEQLHLTRNTKSELDKILNKYEGDSKREIGEAMRKHGVDQQVYHSGMIVAITV